MQDPRRFQNYRDFLAACFAEEKGAARGLSLAKFSERLGLSESSLRMILAGRRNLTVHNIHVLARAFRFSSAQTEIFEAMVLRDQAESSAERQYYQRRLRQAGTAHGLEERRVVDSTFVREWFGPALLVYLLDHGLDASSLDDGLLERLSRQLKVPKRQIRATVEWYDKNGYFNREEAGDVRFVFDRVATVPVEAQPFLKRNFSEAISRVDSDFSSGRSLFSVNTLSLDSRRIPSFVADYKELIERYTKAPRDSAFQAVFQVCFAALRLLD